MGKKDLKRKREEEESEEKVEEKKEEKKEEKEEKKEGEKEGKEKSVEKKRGGGKHIAFVGNLPYSATKETILKHFKCTEDEEIQVRLMTDKNTGKPKGFAFVEFSTAAALTKGLKLHHSDFDGRKINVELTAGGGGKSQKRKQKLKQKNNHLRKARNNHFEQVVKKRKTTPSPSS